MPPPYNHKCLEVWKSGFTLAETLIALVIVGIVAALTVPTLIAKYQKEQTVTKLKKAYSAIAQTTARAVADNGPIDTWTIKTLEPKEFVDKYMAPYLSVMKNCGYETTGACSFKYASLNNPKNFRNFDNTYSRLILQDGTAIMSFAYGMDGISVGGQVVNLKELILYIDINGQKAPNVLGKDIFAFAYCIDRNDTPLGGYKAKGKILPYAGTISSVSGQTRDTYKSDCSKTTRGYSCSSLIMADNWEIADDYPW